MAHAEGSHVLQRRIQGKHEKNASLEPLGKEP